MFEILIPAVIGSFLGFIITFVIYKNKVALIKKEKNFESIKELTITNEKLIAKSNECLQNENLFKEANEKINLNNELINNLSSENAGLKEKVKQISELNLKLNQKEEHIEKLYKEHAENEKQISKIKTLLDEERKQATEKIELLKEAKEQLKTEFENLANKIFDDKSNKFVEKNKLNLDSVINPFKEQLGDFKKKVEDVYDKESKDRASLFTEIKHLKNLNERISKDAINLTHALKGDKKAQGNWGEVILERILEESGLQKGREYDLQVSLKDEKGNLFKPDVLVKLPDNKQIVIDSKVSLNSYESYYSCEDLDEKKRHLKNHISAIRNHTKELSFKNYDNLVGLNSLDYVLMFIPIEAAFLTALRESPELFNEAISKNIIPVSSSTLFVTLRTIQNVWQIEYQNRNAREIAKKAGDLYDKFVGFVESLESVGKHLDKAKESYITSHNRLVSGSGNLVNRVQAMKKLGVMSKKDLEASFLEEAQLELPLKSEKKK